MNQILTNMSKSFIVKFINWLNLANNKVIEIELTITK